MTTNYTPVESEEYPGFYIIPNYPFHLANKNGDIIQLFDMPDVPKGQIRRPFYNSEGYAVINSPKGMYTARHHRVHRLVCAAFHGAPTPERPLVNHKNGIKYSNAADNLEWVNSSENVNHAFATGLISGKAILLWDTAEDPAMKAITRFNTINDASRHIKQLEGANPNTKDGIAGYLREDKGFSLFHGRFALRYTDDKRPWPTHEGIAAAGRNRPVYAMNVTTGERVRGDNRVDLSKKINIGEGLIRKNLNKGSQSTSGWVYSYDHDADWQSLIEKYLILSNVTVGYNKVTKTIVIGDTIADLALRIGMDKHKVWKLITKNVYEFGDHILFKLNDKSDVLRTLKTNHGILI